MADLYTRMRGRATRLLDKYGQGSVAYIQPGSVSGPGYAPVVGTPTTHTLDATVTGVAQQYVDGTTILATDLMVMCSVFGAEPTVAGHLTIDGRTLQIVRVDRVPAAGTVIVWRLFVRA